MNFEADDLDWALGELMALIWRGKASGIPAHNLEPELFYDCMCVVSAQPFKVRSHVLALINSIAPMRVSRWCSWK
jgi:hypothetical protein